MKKIFGDDDVRLLNAGIIHFDIVLYVCMVAFNFSVLTSFNILVLILCFVTTATYSFFFFDTLKKRNAMAKLMRKEFSAIDIRLSSLRKELRNYSVYYFIVSMMLHTLFR